MQKKKLPAKRTSAPADASAHAQKRPASGSPVPSEVIDSVAALLRQIKSELEPYAAHLRPLDRKRLNGVGIKKQGFIERTYEYVMDSPQFLPHYLTQRRFSDDHEYFCRLRGLSDSTRQIDEVLCNIRAQASDADYTNSLDYYASSREAAKRRVDGAETIYNDLELTFVQYHLYAVICHLA